MTETKVPDLHFFNTYPAAMVGEIIRYALCSSFISSPYLFLHLFNFTLTTVFSMSRWDPGEFSGVISVRSRRHSRTSCQVYRSFLPRRFPVAIPCALLYFLYCEELTKTNAAFHSPWMNNVSESMDDWMYENTRVNVQNATLIQIILSEFTSLAFW